MLCLSVILQKNYLKLFAENWTKNFYLIDPTNWFKNLPKIIKVLELIMRKFFRNLPVLPINVPF